MEKRPIKKLIALGIILFCFSLIPLLSITSKWLFDDPEGYGLRVESNNLVKFEWLDYTLFPHQFPLDDIEVTYLFMGFLSCSEICPIRIQQMRQLEQLIDVDPMLSNQSINFMFITIDPQNDTTEVRNQIIDQRSTRFISAELSEKQLMRLNQQLSENINRQLQTINHVGNLFLISSTGKVERIYTAKQLSTNDMLAELKHYFYSVN
ncbi:SCO family protein [Shewanella donghaensis]|uniref:SCO family protein n=1 Tax=Shewanella donghaensis TaxID=238836 RepID=UPI001183EAAD|nr:SCO family protein [Shewanella donghaensis]